MSKRFRRTASNGSQHRRLSAARWLASGGLLLITLADPAQAVTILAGTSSTVNNASNNVNALSEHIFDGTFNDTNLTPVITAGTGFLSGTGPTPIFRGTLTNTNLSFGDAAVNARTGNLMADNDFMGAAYFGKFVVGGASPFAAGQAYTFGTRSDDGSAVFLDVNNNGTFEAGELLVSNLGSHGEQNRVGTTPVLAAGSYNIAIGWYEGNGGALIEARVGAGTVTEANYGTLAVINPAVAHNNGFTTFVPVDQDLTPENIVVDGNGVGGTATLDTPDLAKTTYNALKFQNTGGNATTLVKTGGGTVRVAQTSDTNAVGANDTVRINQGELQLVLKNGVNPMGAGNVHLNGGTLTIENNPTASNGLSARLVDGDRGLAQLNFQGAFTAPSTGNLSQAGTILGLSPTFRGLQSGAVNLDGTGLASLFGYAGGRDQFQAIWTGLFNADVTGIHNFDLRGFNAGGDVDDNGSFYLDANQNGSFEAGEQILTDNAGALALNLTAGQSYAVAFSMNEDGGGEGINVRFQEPAGGAFAAALTNISPGTQGNRWSTFLSAELAINMSGTDVEVSANSILNPVTILDAKFGDLTFSANAVLNTKGAAKGTSFTGTTINNGVTAVGFNTTTNATLGQLDLSNNGSLVTITKTGAADLVVGGQTLNVGPGGLAWNAQAGRLVAVHDGNNPLATNGAIALANTTLALSIKSGNALETFNNSITVNGNSTLTAGLHSDGLAGPKTARVGSAGNGVNITGGNRLSVTTTDNYTIDFAGAVTGTGIFDITNANATFSGPGATVGTLAVNGNQIGLIGSGALKLNAGGTYMFNPTVAVPNINVNVNLGSLGTDAAANVQIGDNDVVNGVVTFSGNNTYTGFTRIRRGELVLNSAASLTSGNLNFASNDEDQPALLVTNGLFNRTIGTGAGQVQFSENGGFGAKGGTLTVTLNGGADILWANSTANGGFNNRQVMHFGGTTADSMTLLTNNIALRSSGESEFQVADNALTKNDFLRVTGNLTGGNAANQFRFNESSGANNIFTNSLIELLGNNTYLNATRIDDAVLRAVDGVGLSSASNLRFSRNSDTRMATFESSGILARTLGTGAGQVHFEQNTGGGFSAFGGDLSVRFNGDDGTGNVSVNWNSNTGAVDDIDNRLMLGSIYATHVTTLTNDINGQNGNRAITLFDNADVNTDFSRFSGDLTNFNGLETFGNGTVEFTGTINFVAGNPDLKSNDTTRMIVRGTANIGDLIAEEQSTIEVFGTVNATANVTNNNGGGTIIVRSGGNYNGTTAASDIDINTGGKFIVDAGGQAVVGDDFFTAGIVTVNGTLSVADVADVESGGTLNGSGTFIVGTDIDILNGGKVAPGNSPGLLTLQRTTVSASAEFLDFNTGSILEVEFAQAGFDQILLINGMLDLDTDWNLRLISDGRGIIPSEELYLILFGANAGILTGQDLTPIITLLVGPNGNPWLMPASNVTLGVNATGVFITGLSVAPTQVAITVPEPTTLILAGFAGLTLASRRRRQVR